MKTSSSWPDDNIILYDGICVLCSNWMRFIAKRDHTYRFRFTAIQSPYGRSMAQALGIDPDSPDTNAVILNGCVLRRSDAALAVLACLPYWSWVSFLRIVPRIFRDIIYTFIARNRYRLFGRHDFCDLSGATFADRIIVSRLIGEDSKDRYFVD